MQINLLDSDTIKQGRTEYERLQPEIGSGYLRKGIDPFTRDLVQKNSKDNINIERLMNGERIFVTRKDAQWGMECRRYVNDGQVLNMVKDKLSIAMCENVYGMKEDYFKGGILKAGWERDRVRIWQ